MLITALRGQLKVVQGGGCRCTDTGEKCDNFSHSVVIIRNDGIKIYPEDLPEGELQCLIWKEEEK